jgi:dUTP pyrophosphatase
MPRRATDEAVGFDVCAAEAAVIPAGGYRLVRTGLVLELPIDIEAQVRPRSGLAANKGIGILNSPGTIDPDYRGELKVILFNVSAVSYSVAVGDRIAQLVFRQLTHVELHEVNTVTPTERADRGFGSTGA